MASLGKVTFGFRPPQSSDYETVNSQGPPVTHWHLGHSLFQCPGCFLKAHWSQSSFECPFCSHLAHWFWIPNGSCTVKWPRKSGLPFMVCEWTGPPPSFGPFVYFSGCIQPFQPYPYYWKPNKNWNKSLKRSEDLLLPAVAFWILRLKSGADWVMKCIAKRICPSGEEGSTFGCYLKASTNLSWKTAGFPSGSCWTSFTFSIIDGFHYKIFHTR